MKTTLKSNVKQGDFYNLRDLENMVELTVLIRNAENKLKPCPCCGSTSIEKIGYILKIEEDKPYHYFEVACIPNEGNGYKGCGIRTFRWRAGDSVESIQGALDYISATWNRRPEK
jgi:hypothetical protein